MKKQIEKLIEKYEEKKAKLEVTIEKCKGSQDGNVQALRHSAIATRKIVEEIIEDLNA